MTRLTGAVAAAAVALGACTAPSVAPAPAPVESPVLEPAPTAAPGHSAAATEPFDIVDIPHEALLNISVGVGQDGYFLCLLIGKGAPDEREYLALCGSVDHDSNAVGLEVHRAGDAARLAHALGDRAQAVIGVSGDEIRSIRWWIDEL